jgi:hypothetical protein
VSQTALIAVRLVVALGMIVVVPLGLRLVGDLPGGLVRWWPVAGVAGAGSLWLPRGAAAVATATIYAAATLLLVLVALGRGLAWSRACAGRGSSPQPAVPPGSVELAVGTALLGPAVAACALVAERAGVALFGFGPGILTLTVPHLHFAGFAAALIAGLVARRTAGDPHRRGLAPAVALTVPCGTVLVLVGYFIGDWAELVGAVVLTVGMWLAGWLTWTRVRVAVPHSQGVRGARAARVLFGASAAVLAVTMLLALSWALGEATGRPHPSLNWMVATHGVANALGFALCGLLAWRLVREEPL